MLREIDRRDLTISLRERLGDWFRVVQVKQPTHLYTCVYLSRSNHTTKEAETSQRMDRAIYASRPTFLFCIQPRCTLFLALFLCRRHSPHHRRPTRNQPHMPKQEDQPNQARSQLN